MENKKLKNIVLITLDCVRPDHIGCFGYKNVNTSIMDQLARKGIIFEQAFSQAPNTWVSLASIFTGCNPTKHDLHTPYDKISGKTPTMAETLSKNGYYTIGFPAHGLVGKIADFHRGFNFFYDDNLKFDSKIKDVKWGSNWKKVLEIANTEIRKNDQKPLFIWFHYMNTHHFPENSIPLPYLYRFRFSSKWQYYDGKISYADKNCIKNIVKLLKKNGIFEDTIIIIFSDHGEELENNKFPKHDNLLYDDVLRILFLISAPDIIPVN
jgi:arylsulfatase A-like enzyme